MYACMYACMHACIYTKHIHTYIDGQEALGLLWSLSAIPGTLDQYTNETLVDMVRIGRTSSARDGWRQTAALSALHNLLCYSGYFFCFNLFLFLLLSLYFFFTSCCCATQATARSSRLARSTWRSRRSMSTPAPPSARRRRRRSCWTSAASIRAPSSPPLRPSGK